MTWLLRQRRTSWDNPGIARRRLVLVGCLSVALCNESYAQAQLFPWRGDNGRWGLLGQHGQVVVEARYRRTTGDAAGFAVVVGDAGCGYVNTKGQPLTEPRFRRCSAFSEDGLAVVYTADGCGYVTAHGEVITEPRFRACHDSSDGLGLIKTREGESVFVAPSGQIELEGFTAAYPFSQGLAAVEKDGWRFIDTSGETVFAVDGRIDRDHTFSEGGYAVVTRSVTRDDRRWTEYELVGRRGEPVHLPFDGARPDDFLDGVAAVARFGFQSDQPGNRMVIAPQFEEANAFHEGLAAVQKRGRWGFVDPTGEVVVDFLFEDATWFSEGLAAVRLGCWGYINRAGEVVIPFRFAGQGAFSNGVASVHFGEAKCGALNAAGEVTRRRRRCQQLTPCTPPTPAQEKALLAALSRHALERNASATKMPTGAAGLTPVKRYAFFDIHGRQITRFAFSDARKLHEGRARVCCGPRWGFVDNTGMVVVDCQFADTSDFHEGLAAVKEGGLWGYIDPFGRMLIQPRFSSAGNFHHGLAEVTVGRKRMVVNRLGRVYDVHALRPQQGGALETE